MKVLSISNEQLVSHGIKAILQEHFKQIEVTSTADDEEIENLSKEKQFDVILLNLSVLSIQTESLIEKIKHYQENAKMLIVSNSDYKQYVVDYIRLGVSGFLDKSSSGQDLILAIKLIRSGQMYLSKEMLMSIYYNNLNSRENEFDNPFSKLSKRELDVFKLLIKGKRIKNISETLKIHQSTASTLKKRIMQKLNVDNLIHLNKKAMEYGY